MMMRSCNKHDDDSVHAEDDYSANNSDKKDKKER